MKKRAKIIYIVNSLNVGGSQKILVESANSFDLRKYDITIVSLSLKDTDRDISNVINTVTGINVFYFDFNFPSDYSILGYFKLLFKDKKDYQNINLLEDLIRKEKPDIIHFHTSPRELIFKRFLDFKCSYVFTDHTLRICNNEFGLVKSFLLKMIFRKLYKGFSVVSVSEEIENSLVNNNVLTDNTKTLILTNSIDVEKYTRSNIKYQSSVFSAVYVSRITKNKGHYDLINAWSKFCQLCLGNCILYIVGPDDLHGEIQEYAVKKKCIENVIFTGQLSDTREILEKSDIGIFPSYKEGLPLALLEKMAMQIPVIVSDIKELRSVIADGHDGLVFKLGDENDLLTQVVKLHNSPELISFLGNNAREKVIMNYNSFNNTSKLDYFYNELINNG